MVAADLVRPRPLEVFSTYSMTRMNETRGMHTFVEIRGAGVVVEAAVPELGTSAGTESQGRKNGPGECKHSKHCLCGKFDTVSTHLKYHDNSSVDQCRQTLAYFRRSVRGELSDSEN